MRLRLLAMPSISTALLLSTLGCSKKDDLTSILPAGTGIASYKLDGKTITCTVQVDGGYAQGSGHSGLNYDFVSVTLKTTPEPADGPEILKLTYSRPNVGADYQLSDPLYYYTKGSLDATWDFSAIAGKVMLKSQGGFAGTFTGQARVYGSMPPPYTDITAGVFDSRP
jgi:hypothetical protein